MINIFRTYSKLSQPTKASLWFTVTNILQKGIQFIVIPIYTRVLTTEEYGAYSLFQSWLSIVTIIATLNLVAGVYNNGMVKYEGNEHRFTSCMQGLTTTATVFFIILCLPFLKMIKMYTGFMNIELVLMMGVVIFSPAFGFWSLMERFQYKYKSLVLITILSAVSVPVISLILLKLWCKTAFSMIVGYSVVQIVIGVPFYIKHMIQGRSFFSKEYWRFALCFNLPLIPHYLAGVVLGQADRIMIGEYCGKAEAGIYGLAYNLSLILNVVIMGINATLIPWTYKSIRDGKLHNLKKGIAQIIALLACLSIFVILIGPEVIKIMGSTAYYTAIWVIPPITFSTYCIFVYTTFANIEFYYEKTKYVMVASVSAAITNIVLNAIFIPRYGFIAAGYTTELCYLIMVVAHYFFMMKTLKEKKQSCPYNIKAIWGISVVLLGFSYVAVILYKYDFLRYSLILFLFVIIVACHKKVKSVITNIYSEK